jgi:hypothetical protein
VNQLRNDFMPVRDDELRDLIVQLESVSDFVRDEALRTCGSSYAGRVIDSTIELLQDLRLRSHRLP